MLWSLCGGQLDPGVVFLPWFTTDGGEPALQPLHPPKPPSGKRRRKSRLQVLPVVVLAQERHTEHAEHLDDVQWCITVGHSTSDEDEVENLYGCLSLTLGPLHRVFAALTYRLAMLAGVDLSYLQTAGNLCLANMQSFKTLKATGLKQPNRA